MHKSLTYFGDFPHFILIRMYLLCCLQTLEQLGNGSCDLRYNGAIGGQSSLVPPTRPFDLNCAVYNQVTSSCEPGAPLVATVSLSTDSPATSHLSSEVWPSATSVSRHFGGPGQFSDPLQEQFCHQRDSLRLEGKQLFKAAQHLRRPVSLQGSGRTSKQAAFLNCDLYSSDS